MGNADVYFESIPVDWPSCPLIDMASTGLASTELIVLGAVSSASRRCPREKHLELEQKWLVLNPLGYTIRPTSG